jgi:magnesium-transporting ATPase (P-type)
MGFFASILTTPIRLSDALRGNGIGISKQLIDSALKETSTVFEQLYTSPSGLSAGEVETRLESFGPNEMAREKRQTWYMRLWDNVKNPLVILLVVLGVISYLTEDVQATIMIFLMVVLGFVPLPPLYWLLLLGMLLCYVLLTQVVKTWFVRKFGEA